MSHKELETKFLQTQIDAIVEKVLQRAKDGHFYTKWYLSHVYNFASVDKIHLLETPSYYLDYIVAKLKLIFPNTAIHKNLIETFIRIDWS